VSGGGPVCFVICEGGPWCLHAPDSGLTYHDCTAVPSSPSQAARRAYSTRLKFPPSHGTGAGSQRMGPAAPSRRGYPPTPRRRPPIKNLVVVPAPDALLPLRPPPGTRGRGVRCFSWSGSPSLGSRRRGRGSPMAGHRPCPPPRSPSLQTAGPPGEGRPLSLCASQELHLPPPQDQSRQPAAGATASCHRRKLVESGDAHPLSPARGDRTACCRPLRGSRWYGHR
jgi:hypothetical protein